MCNSQGRLRQGDQAGAALRRSALSPSAPARHPQGLLCPLHVAAGIWDPLRPVEPVLEARSHAVAGNPVTSSPFGPGGSGCVPGAALPGQPEPLSPPWMLSNLGKAHTGWEERHREVKPLARGHPKGPRFEHHRPFPGPRPRAAAAGIRICPLRGTPCASTPKQAVGCSRALTSKCCWRLCGRGLKSQVFKNTSRMPFLNSDPASQCCCQPAPLRNAPAAPLGCARPRPCRGWGRQQDPVWGCFPSVPDKDSLSEGPRPLKQLLASHSHLQANAQSLIPVTAQS